MADFFEFDIEIDAKKFREDVENYLDQYMIGATTYVADTMTDLANKEMQLFYENYEPHRYIRTENLKGHSITRILDHIGDTYRGGVRISGETMYPYYRSGHDENGFLKPFDKDRRPYVIQSFLSGYHGFKGQIPDKLTPTPDEVLSKEFEGIYDKALKMGTFRSRYGGKATYNYKYEYGDNIMDYIL